MSNWPEHSEELARKALDTLGRAAFDLAEGTLNKESFLLVINTIVDTTQGLIPNEVTDLILKVRKEI
jgi:hypothetical protein